MRFAKPPLLALCGVCAALAAPAPASAAGWKPGLQQKTCATLEWRPNGSSSLLRVYNTDGTEIEFFGNGITTPFVPDALSQQQALMVAACSPNVKAPHGHTYWVSVFNPNAPIPVVTSLVMTYPPSGTPPVFKTPPKGLWTTGMQTKTCAAIELVPGNAFINVPDSVVLHNTDGSQLALPGVGVARLPRYPAVAESSLQAAAIDACGPNADVSHEGRHYRVSVDNPNLATPNPTRLLFRPPQQ